MVALGDLVKAVVADSVKFAQAMGEAEARAAEAQAKIILLREELDRSVEVRRRTVTLRSRYRHTPDLMLVIKPLAAALVRARLVTL